jgi:hypothetical protein
MKLILALAALAATSDQGGENLVTRAPQPHIGVGHCVMTSVHRFEDVRDALTTAHAIFYQDGIAQYDFSDKPRFNEAKAGDSVKVCLVAIPQSCPPGDDRGKTYRATDLRTHRTWTLPDDMHYCGGA